MSGIPTEPARFLFDSNILIDHLNTISAATAQLESVPEVFISIVTWIDVIAGAKPSQQGITRFTLSNCIVLSLTDAIAERAATLRRSSKLKLPDAIILATAQFHALTLVTRNTATWPPSPISASLTRCRRQ